VRAAHAARAIDHPPEQAMQSVHLKLTPIRLFLCLAAALLAGCAANPSTSAPSSGTPAASAPAAGANGGPAKEATIKQLMETVHSRQLVDGVRAQFNTVIEHSVQTALNGRKPTPRQQQAIDKMKKRMLAVMDSEMSWEKLEPMSIRLYQQTFSEDELQGMLAFYKTPAGQAVINKMPALMQNLMAEVQHMVADMDPQLEQVMNDFQADMKAAGK
jgi:hypothetical protein